MSDQARLEEHLLAEPRCEARDIRREDTNPDGMNRDKMALIHKHGVSWGYIYNVLFPGAQVPDPCRYHPPRMI